MINNEDIFIGNDLIQTSTDGEYGFNTYTYRLMRHVPLVMVLVVITAASLVGLDGAGSAGAAQPDAAEAARPTPTCSQFWSHSGHTDRVRWYHCHSTDSPLTKRVHICGYSGTLHGISVTSRSDGRWPRDRHKHDRGGEGCRR